MSPRLRRPPRVVLDTNVVASALLFGGGVPGQLRRAWQRGEVLPLVCSATAAELIRVLAYPKLRLSAEDREELLADYLPMAEVVALPELRPPVPACRGPHDLPFLHLAAAGRAAALVSGDADLLSLAPQVRWRIVTSADFAGTLGDLPAR